jgi:hypothetical protein
MRSTISAATSGRRNDVEQWKLDFLAVNSPPLLRCLLEVKKRLQAGKRLTARGERELLRKGREAVADAAPTAKDVWSWTAEDCRWWLDEIHGVGSEEQSVDKLRKEVWRLVQKELRD